MRRRTCESRTAILALFVALLALAVGSACGGVKATPDAGTDATSCDPLPTEQEVCADRCGEVVVCGMSFACGGCSGELSCGADNTCGCASSPCAVASVTTGDASIQTLVDVAVDSNGNVFAAGNFRGTVTFGSNSYTSGPTRPDMFVVKLDPAGEVLWSNAFGDVPPADSEQLVTAIDVDAAGNLVVVGYSYGPTNLGGTDLPCPGGDMVIAKFDPDGSHVFSNNYGTQFSIDATALSIDRASQDILVTGRFWGTLQFGSLSSMTAAGTQAYFDIFVVRFTASGTPAFSKRYGDGSEQIPEAITASGNFLYLSSYFTGTYDYGAPNTTPVSTTSFYALALTKLGINTFAHGWTHQYGTDVYDSRLAGDPSGNVFVSGGFGGTLDISTPALDSAEGETFLAKIDADGTTAWAKQLANVSIAKLAAGADGSVYAAGYANGDVDLGAGTVAGSGTNDPFIAHYAADGAHLWSRVFVAAVGDQNAKSIAVAADGTTWIGADYEGTIDFGLGPVTTQGGTDIAVTGYVP
jgi:hypothetical protein